MFKKLGLWKDELLPHYNYNFSYCLLADFHHHDNLLLILARAVAYITRVSKINCKYLQFQKTTKINTKKISTSIGFDLRGVGFDIAT